MNREVETLRKGHMAAFDSFSDGLLRCFRISFQQRQKSHAG